MNKITVEFNALSIVAAATQDIILSDGKPAFDLSDIEGAGALFNYFARNFAKDVPIFLNLCAVRWIHSSKSLSYHHLLN
jgi:hypothetical protein